MNKFFRQTKPSSIRFTDISHVQILLSTPKFASITDLKKDNFLEHLQKVLQLDLVTALLVRRAKLNETNYQHIVQSIIPVAQSHDCAVILDDLPDLVLQTGADGVHLEGGHSRFLSVKKLLKPEFIVGAANILSRHDAMLRAEAGADYVSFGGMEKLPDQTSLDLALWWTELFEIPCAVFDCITDPQNIEIPSCEFLGLGDNIWNSSDRPSEALTKVPLNKNATAKAQY